MPTQLTSKQLRHAADLMDAIEDAKKELAALLGSPAPITPAAATPKKGRPTRSKAGRPKSADTTAGTVREILAGSAKPLKLDDLIKALAERGRPLGDAKNARKMFSLRLYKMAGVKRVGRGLFAATK